MYFEISQNDNSPIVCNVPHSGTDVPSLFLSDYVISSSELEREVFEMADLHTDFLYEELLSVSSYIKSDISRVVVDIERFPKEEDEPMSKVGMSAFYTLTSKGKVLRAVSDEKRNVLQEIYDEYHKSFTQLVASSLALHNRAFIVDCHSFPSIPRQYEPDQADVRPDICIGTDEYHTPEALSILLKNNFEELGYSVKINSPFAGTIVPLTYYRKNRHVISVMIEVNRKLYMNEETFKRLPDFSVTSKTISRCVIKSLNEFVK
jgi:N-formylglutamate deformylase